jgi:NAD-dependent deacetylase
MRAAPSTEDAAQLLAGVSSILVLTGAGVSKESGIPTFRDAMEGLWAKFDPQKLATPEGFLEDPKLVWQWYDFRRKAVMAAKPNPGHHAIAELALKKPTTVVTQNVDGLHQKAGSQPVIELHGNIMKFICFDHRHPIENVEFGLDAPPHCDQCGSPARPAVVWFGEQLPVDVLTSATTLAKTVGAVIVVGTSGLVQPAASLPFYAYQRGIPIIEVNPDPTPITDIATFFLAGPSGQILPKLVSLVE